MPPVLPPKGSSKDSVTQEVQWVQLCLHRHTRPEHLCRTLLLGLHVWACTRSCAILSHSQFNVGDELYLLFSADVMRWLCEPGVSDWMHGCK